MDGKILIVRLFTLAFFKWLFVAIPLLILRPSYKLFLTLFGLILLEDFVLNILRGKHFFGLEYNWQGKILETLWPLLAVYAFRWFDAKKVGYPFSHKRSDYLLAVLLGGAIAFVAWSMDYFSGYKNLFPSTETIIFQMTMPGIAEESVYRGIFFALFGRYCPQKWTCYGVPISVRTLLTSLLFMAAHVVAYSPSEQTLFFNWTPAISTFIVGMVLGTLREKTGSIWPCVLTHNVANTLYVLL